jgi:hypothetical protein
MPLNNYTPRTSYQQFDSRRQLMDFKLTDIIFNGNLMTVLLLQLTRINSTYTAVGSNFSFLNRVLCSKSMLYRLQWVSKMELLTAYKKIWLIKGIILELATTGNVTFEFRGNLHFWSTTSQTRRSLRPILISSRSAIFIIYGAVKLREGRCLDKVPSYIL